MAVYGSTTIIIKHKRVLLPRRVTLRVSIIRAVQYQYQNDRALWNKSEQSGIGVVDFFEWNSCMEGCFGRIP